MKFRYIDFYNELKQDKFIGLKCEACGAFIFPLKDFCPECGSEKLKTVEFTKKGEIKTFTIIRVAPEGFHSPYVVAIVELPEGPRIMGNLDHDPEKADLSLIGKKVVIGWKQVKGDKFSGGDGVTFTFKLID